MARSSVAVLEPSAWDAELDPKERKFVELYLETNNGTRSALVAGFGSTAKSAGVQASKLLARGRIAKAVERRNAEIMAQLDFTPDRIIRELAKIAGLNAGDLMTIDEHGNPHVDFSQVTRAQTAAIASIESPTEKSGAKFKTYDKIKALTELAKLARMYPAEQHEVTGANGAPIAHMHAHAHKIDIASLEPEQRDQLRGVLLALKAKQGDDDGDGQ